MKINKKKIISGLILTSFLIQPLKASAYTKTETVFANLDYNGNLNKTVVNNHLSKLNKETIEDYTYLSQITNLNGEEKYQKDKEKLIWNASKEDIFYQGTTKKDLPITVDIEYFLNGKKTHPKKMLNKKGAIKIKIKLKNNSYDNSTNLHTPFVITSGIILDSTKDKNIEITNGEIEETGTRSIALALAAPGLYEDLKIEELKKLDEIELNYKTEKFTLNNIYLVATPKLLEKIDLKNLNKVNTLEKSLKTIEDNMNKLDEGAKSLTQGTMQLENGSNEITSNLNTLHQAIKRLDIGSNNLNDGLKKTITALETVKKSLENKDINASLTKVQTLINTNNSTISLLQNTNTSLKVNYDNYQLQNFQTDQDLINHFTNIGTDQNTINNLLTCKKTYEANLNIINLLTINNETLSKMTTSLQEISHTVESLLLELNKALYQLENGSSELSNGLKQIDIGLEKLYNGSLSLKDGTKNLRIGSNTLSNGLTTLNKEGINQLTKNSEKLTNYTNKTKELINLSKNYKGYSTTNSNKTSFIFKVKSIK